jgi:hypothetical protein
MANNTETTDTGVATNDAYTGMLVVSLLALIVGSILLFMDWSQHSGTPPKSVLPAPPQVKAAPPQEKDADKKEKDLEKKDKDVEGGK